MAMNFDYKNFEIQKFDFWRTSSVFVWLFVVFILGLVVFLLLFLITIIACIWWTLKMIFNWKSNLLWISKTNLVKARKDAFPNRTATFEYTIVVPMLKLGLEIVTAILCKIYRQIFCRWQLFACRITCSFSWSGIISNSNHF